MRMRVEASLCPLYVTSLLLLTAGCRIGDDASFDDDAGLFDAGVGDSSVPRADAEARDSGAEPDGSPAGAYEPSDVTAARAEAICDALVACQGEALLTEQLGGADCVERTTRAFASGPLQYLERSVEAGRVVFRAEAFDACLSDIRDQGCSVQRSRRPERCETALAGSVPLGGDCSLDEDCRGLAYCDGGSEKEGECPGICRELLGPTETCSHSDQCQDGFVCAGGQCVAPLQGGESCADPDPPAPCSRGFECVAISADESVCRSFEALRSRGLDEACAPPDMLCKPGLSCVNFGDTPTCAMPVGEDEPCGRAIPNQCPAYQYCDAVVGERGQCVDLPSDGEACLGRQGLRCAPMHVCEADDTCHAIGMEGEPCASDRGCFSGICEGADTGGEGSCAPPSLCEL